MHGRARCFRMGTEEARLVLMRSPGCDLSSGEDSGSREADCGSRGRNWFAGQCRRVGEGEGEGEAESKAESEGEGKAGGEGEEGEVEVEVEIEAETGGESLNWTAAVGLGAGSALMGVESAVDRGPELDADVVLEVGLDPEMELVRAVRGHCQVEAGLGMEMELVSAHVVARLVLV